MTHWHDEIFNPQVLTGPRRHIHFSEFSDSFLHHCHSSYDMYVSISVGHFLFQASKNHPRSTSALSPQLLNPASWQVFPY